MILRVQLFYGFTLATNGAKLGPSCVEVCGWSVGGSSITISDRCTAVIASHVKPDVPRRLAFSNFEHLVSLSSEHRNTQTDS